MNNTYNNLLKIYDLPTVNTFVCNTNQDMVIFYIVYIVQKFVMAEMAEDANYKVLLKVQTWIIIKQKKLFLQVVVSGVCNIPLTN